MEEIVPWICKEEVLGVKSYMYEIVKISLIKLGGGQSIPRRRRAKAHPGTSEISSDMDKRIGSIEILT